MHPGPRHPVILGVLAAALGVLGGCASVDPGPMAPPWLEGDPGMHFRVSCHFSGPVPDANPLAVQDRVRGNFERSRVQAYSLFEKGNVLTVTKTILNPPGVLQALEINRYLSAFVRSCAEDRWVTFYRGEDLVGTAAVGDAVRGVLSGRGALTISLENQAFRIHEGVTPQIYTFKKPACRIPLDKVQLGFKPDASRMTLTVRDPQLIETIEEKVGWPKGDRALAAASTFAERISLERTLYAVVAGIVVIQDVVRPGAQLILEGSEPPRWEFGGFVRDRERRWAEALFRRAKARTIERFVLGCRRAGAGGPAGPEAGPSRAPERGEVGKAGAP